MQEVEWNKLPSHSFNLKIYISIKLDHKMQRFIGKKDDDVVEKATMTSVVGTRDDPGVILSAFYCCSVNSDFAILFSLSLSLFCWCCLLFVARKIINLKTEWKSQLFKSDAVRFKWLETSALWLILFHFWILRGEMVKMSWDSSLFSDTKEEWIHSTEFQIIVPIWLSVSCCVDCCRK